ncbi:MAG: hypothetical protein P8L65_01135, partial [Flavobacteriaceae bacterium]|nr:hypothetical protein [Flavobacteriaceae bacterium]
MKKNYFLAMLCIAFTSAISFAQVSYSGNGNSGFGGAIGNASMTINDDGTTITFTFTKGGGNFNDTMAMYISTGASGRNVINAGVNDTNDSNRRAISNTGSGDLTLPAGFNATHGVAINTGFGGLWEIPTGSIGPGGLPFVVAVGNPSSASDASFSFSFDWSEIGLTNTDKFDFVITYGNPNDGGSNMFSSGEAFGDGISGNPGFNAMTFTDSKSYPNTWTGTTDTDWDTATNWTEGMPSSTHNVYIPDVTNQPTAASAVTINKGIIKSGASLIAQSTFVGSMTYERNLETTNWYLISSPVEGQTIVDFYTDESPALGSGTGNAQNVAIAPYDNAQASGTDRWNYYTEGQVDGVDGDDTSDTFATGTGYAIKMQASGDVAFTGTLRTDDVGVSLSDGSGSGGNAFNFIGNPYTSYISVSELIEEDNVATGNEALLSQQTIWLWDQSANTGAGGY